jgi:hypothetical protein
MLGPRAIAGFVLDKFLLDDRDAVTREDGEDLAVAHVLRDGDCVRWCFRVGYRGTSLRLVNLWSHCFSPVRSLGQIRGRRRSDVHGRGSFYSARGSLSFES